MAERMEVQRAIAAPPAEIFRVLSDTKGHVAIDSSGMLMAASGDPLRAVDDQSRQAGIFPVIPESALRATLGILDAP